VGLARTGLTDVWAEEFLRVVEAKFQQWKQQQQQQQQLQQQRNQSPLPDVDDAVSSNAAAAEISTATTAGDGILSIALNELTTEAQNKVKRALQLVHQITTTSTTTTSGVAAP